MPFMSKKQYYKKLPFFTIFLNTYRKPPNISPGPIKLRKHFLGAYIWRGLYLGGLIFGKLFVLRGSGGLIFWGMYWFRVPPKSQSFEIKKCFLLKKMYLSIFHVTYLTIFFWMQWNEDYVDFKIIFWLPLKINSHKGTFFNL